MNFSPTFGSLHPRKHANLVRVSFALLLALIGQFMVFGTTHAAGTITVDRTDDTTAASACTASANDCSLRGAFAFADANSGTTISVPAGTYQLTVDELKIGTSAGNNTTIVGAGAATTIIKQTVTNRRVINVNPNYLANVVVSISGVTITGGNSPTSDSFHGGGILGGGPGNTLNLSNCIIDGNTDNSFTAPKGGGVEFAGGGFLNIDNCTISNNTTGSTTNNLGVGGGVDYQLLNNAGAAGQGGLSITNSTFTGNKAGAQNGAGGALRVAVSTTQTPRTVTITNNTFTGNQANAASGGYGGAIRDDSSYPITVKFNRFANNSATGGASGIYHTPGDTGTIDATENWWGCNGGPGSTGCDSIGGDATAITIAPRIILTNTASPTPIKVNQTSTLTASFLKDSAGNSLTLANLSEVLGLPITFGSATRGTISGAQTTIQSDGTATATFTANAAGAGSATATVDNGPAVANSTINKADTTTSISSDTPDPSVTGQSVTVNFHVTSSTGSTPTAPTGSVTVSDGTNSCTGTINSSGDGTCNVALMSAGSKTLTATYGGDSNFNASPASTGVAHTVNKADTTASITSDTPDPSVVGQSVTVNYSVTVNTPGSGTPTGNVTVSDGTQSCTGTVAAGQCSITFTSAGAKSLTATYAGDANYNASPASAGVAHTVNKADTTTTITSDNPDPSNVGQAVTVNYSVTVNSPGAGTPTGNVTVGDGVDSCTGTVSAGTCSLTLTTPDARTLTATYAGDSNFNASSDTEAHTVSKRATTTTITSDTPDPSVVGQSVTVQYSVVPTAGSGTPTGNVTVSDGTQSCTGTVAAGQCSITFTSAGAKSLTATYAGDANFDGSASAAEAHQVNKANTTTTITSDDPDPSRGGQAVTVQYTVTVNSPGAGTPTGSVTVSDGVDSCTGTVAAGQCSITLSTGGAQTLTANYADDSNFNASSDTEAHTVDNTAPTVTINQAAGQADPTGSSPIHFTVIFSEPVTGFATDDVTLSGTAGATTATVTQIAPNDGTTYDVAVSGMTSNGTVIASIAAGVAQDAVGNPNTASTSTDNTVTFTLNSPPVANNDSASTNEDTPVTISVLANDSDPDNNTLTVSSVTQPANGTATVNPNNTVTYTPAPNFNGSDSFTYTISDGKGGTATATVNVTVNAVNDRPSFSYIPLVTVVEDSGPYSAPWASNISAGPANESGQTLTFQVTNNTNTALFSTAPAIAANGTLTFTPAPNANGSANITVLLKDNGGTANGGQDTSAPATFTINITAVNDAPTVTVAGSARPGQCASDNPAKGTISLMVGDVETAAASLNLTGSSSNTQLVPNNNIVFSGSGANRTVTITAAPKRSGSAVITIRVSDGATTTTLTITFIVGTDNSETLTGTNGADMIFGLNGDDTINGLDGNDLLCGGNGVGTMNGGAGDDTLDGGNGNDVLNGGDDNDTLRGGSGNDTLNGENGNDTLTGSLGADRFSGGPGTDTATDITPSQGDTTDGTIP